MWDVTNTPLMQTQRSRCVPWDCGAKLNRLPHRGRGSALIPFVTTRPNHVDIYCPLQVQGSLTALKRVYKVERSPYLYNARKFLPYPMWDVRNTPPPPPPPCRHNVLVVSHGIAGPNETDPHIGVGDRL